MDSTQHLIATDIPWSINLPICIKDVIIIVYISYILEDLLSIFHMY